MRGQRSGLAGFGNAFARRTALVRRRRSTVLLIVFCAQLRMIIPHIAGYSHELSQCGL